MFFSAGCTNHNGDDHHIDAVLRKGSDTRPPLFDAWHLLTWAKCPSAPGDFW